MSRQQNSFQETPQYDIFFSYSRKDTAAAMLVKSAIQSLGYSVFYDQDILEGDDNWRATLAKSIDLCSGLVFLRTGHSVDSVFCQREVLYAEDSGKSILPVAFRHDQAALPNSDPLKLLFQPLQTTFISDSPTLAGLKDELRPALEKSVGKPRGKENSLLLTDLMATAADNLNSRYRDFFERIQARRIESDVLNDRISLVWPFVLGDEQAKLCISLNKFSKRSVCFANCRRKDGAGEKSCKFFNNKDLQEEYSLEAYLDFADRARKSPIEPLLGSLFPAWCGNRGTKYFFRRRIEGLEGEAVDEKNDFAAALELLREAILFFDACFNARMKEYFQFAYGIVSIFREKDPASLVGEGWSLHDEQKSRVKLHFTKNDPSDRPDESELGKLCSCAIEFPEALRIKLDRFDPDGILARICRFDRNMKKERLMRFSPGDPGEPREMLKDGIGRILQVPAEQLEKVSQFPEEVHDSLNRFIHDAPESLCWDVSQDRSGCLLTASCWFPGCPEIRFSIGLACRFGQETIEWDQLITSSFPGAEEDGAGRLSEITGFPVFRRNIENSSGEVCRLLDDAAGSLRRVHDRVYEAVYRPLNELETVSCRWRAWNAVAILLSDSRSVGGTAWNGGGKFGGGSCIDAHKDDERCWEYYLSPGMRFCRRLRREFPVMFCIRFARPGAKDATVGWAADGDFNSLSVREKDLFWHCVLSAFPPEMRDRFVCRKNAVFLAKEADRALDPRERRPEVFDTVRKVKDLLEDWLRDDGAGGGCLMDRMFAVIEKAVIGFKVAEPEKSPKKEMPE